jgi:hypothetical protein
MCSGILRAEAVYRRIPYRCCLACIFDAARWSTTTIRASPPFRDRNHRDFAPSGPGQAQCSRPGLLLALIHRSAQSSTLAIWDRQGQVCLSPIRSKGGESEAPTLSAPILARKFAVLRNRLLSGDSSLTFWGCPFGSVPAAPPRRARRWLWSLKRSSETFFGLPAHTDPQKVSQAFVDPLSGALCRIP